MRTIGRILSLIFAHLGIGRVKEHNPVLHTLTIFDVEWYSKKVTDIFYYILKYKINKINNFDD